jgi:hypothetical protein
MVEDVSRSHYTIKFDLGLLMKPVFELSKNKWGLTISRHAIDLNRYVRMYGGGLKLTPQGIPFGGLSKQLGVQPQPPAIQTLDEASESACIQNRFVSQSSVQGDQSTERLCCYSAGDKEVHHILLFCYIALTLV